MSRLNKAFEYLIFIAMIYIAIDLSSMVFAYKIIKIGPIIGAAASLIFPLTYSIMDVVAEVYGYQIAKKIILYAFFCDFLFSILVLAISHIPSIDPGETLAYLHVLGSLLRAVIAQTIGVLFGAFINVYLISKWKIMTNGRYFWLRSIGSSTIGEGFMLIISVTIALIGVLPITQLSQLIIYTYLYKIIFAIAVAPLICIIVAFLKNKIDFQLFELNVNSLNKLNKQGLIPNFLKS
jgi:queuosine precursor transporter